MQSNFFCKDRCVSFVTIFLFQKNIFPNIYKIKCLNKVLNNFFFYKIEFVTMLNVIENSLFYFYFFFVRS